MLAASVPSEPVAESCACVRVRTQTALKRRLHSYFVRKARRFILRLR